MNNQTKMWACLGVMAVGIVMFEILGMGQELRTGALMILSIGYGWYAKGAVIDMNASSEGKK